MICFAIFSNSGNGMKTHAISRKNKYASGNRQFVSTAGTPKFGTRAVNLGHSLRHLHDKNKLDLFQC